MPWYNALGFGRRPAPPDVPASLTAAAAPVKGPQSQFLQHTQNWQNEAWDFYDANGEYNYGVTWLANMMSQVRLRAARLDPELDEPEILNDGAAAEIIAKMNGGVGGQSQMMRSLSTQLSVPGDCYLIGEQTGPAEKWTVRSVDEVRAQSGRFQVVTGRTPSVEWSDLPPDSIPVRIWRPHERWHHIADSPSRSALSTMRELELVNRHITAQYLSRLASAGVLILPEEVTFPVREEFEDAPDPFVAEWVEVAREGIANPGTASAVVPIPIRVPGEYVDKIKHLDFTLKIDDKIIEKRDSAINRLATQMDIPTEVLTGMGKVNHWTAWQLDEGSLKTHIAPLAEVICYSLTTGYFQARLAASNVPDPEQYVVWYDMSELAIRPDNSTNAQAAYDRLEISGSALRRETGFGEDDAPTTQELEAMTQKAILREAPASPMAAVAADALAGKHVFADAMGGTAASGTGGEVGTKQPAESSDDGAPPGPPSTSPPSQAAPKDTPPSTSPPGAERASAAVIRASAQASAVHVLRYSVDAVPQLLHPPGVCSTHAYSCPFTHSAWGRWLPSLTTGTYEVRLDAFGQLRVGRFAPEMDTLGWITTTTAVGRKGTNYARA
jgi:hypothetical protein